MFKWAKEQKIYDAGFAKGLMLGKAVATRDERERIAQLLEDEFYPLDYGRWQADELMEEIFLLIKGEQR